MRGRFGRERALPDRTQGKAHAIAIGFQPLEQGLALRDEGARATVGVVLDIQPAEGEFEIAAGIAAWQEPGLALAEVALLLDEGLDLAAAGVDHARIVGVEWTGRERRQRNES